MAVRTYIPGLELAFRYLKSYLADHETTLKHYMGDGLYALCVLAVDLATIAIVIITSSAPLPDEPWTDFNSVPTLNATQINQIQGAIDKFWATIGVTP